MAQSGIVAHFPSSRSLVFIALFVCCFTTLVSSNVNERRLISDLLRQNRWARPTLNKTSVTIGLTLWQLIDLYDDRDVLEATWWVSLSWIDHTLSWDPADYGDIEVLSIPRKSIWVPDILVYNQALKSDYMVPIEEQLVSLNSGGYVTLVSSVTYRTSCAVDKSSKTQKCNVDFGSWTRSGDVIDIFPQSPAIDLVGNFSAKWEVVSTSGERVVKMYPCCPEPYPRVVYNIELKLKADEKHYSMRGGNAVNDAKRTAGNLAITLIVFMNVFYSWK